MIAYGLPSMRKLNPVSTKKSKTRWHFGIRSRSYPLDVMGEIYRALKNLGVSGLPQLKKICGRFMYDGSTFNLPLLKMKMLKCLIRSLIVLSRTGEKMKMRIQLYQIEQNNYLVDFKFDGWEGREQVSICRW